MTPLYITLPFVDYKSKTGPQNAKHIFESLEQLFDGTDIKPSIVKYGQVDGGFFNSFCTSGPTPCKKGSGDVPSQKVIPLDAWMVYRDMEIRLIWDNPHGIELAIKDAKTKCPRVKAFFDSDKVYTAFFRQIKTHTIFKDKSLKLYNREKTMGKYCSTRFNAHSLRVIETRNTTFKAQVETLKARIDNGEIIETAGIQLEHATSAYNLTLLASLEKIFKITSMASLTAQKSFQCFDQTVNQMKKAYSSIKKLTKEEYAEAFKVEQKAEILTGRYLDISLTTTESDSYKEDVKLAEDDAEEFFKYILEFLTKRMSVNKNVLSERKAHIVRVAPSFFNDGEIYSLVQIKAKWPEVFKDEAAFECVSTIASETFAEIMFSVLVDVQTKKMGKANISTVNNRIFVNLHLGQLSDFHTSGLADEVLVKLDALKGRRFDTVKKYNNGLSSSEVNYYYRTQQSQINKFVLTPAINIDTDNRRTRTDLKPKVKAFRMIDLINCQQQISRKIENRRLRLENPEVCITPDNFNLFNDRRIERKEMQSWRASGPHINPVKRILNCAGETTNAKKPFRIENFFQRISIQDRNITPAITDSELISSTVDDTRDSQRDSSIVTPDKISDSVIENANDPSPNYNVTSDSVHTTENKTKSKSTISKFFSKITSKKEASDAFRFVKGESVSMFPPDDLMLPVKSVVISRKSAQTLDGSNEIGSHLMTFFRALKFASVFKTSYGCDSGFQLLEFPVQGPRYSAFEFYLFDSEFFQVLRGRTNGSTNGTGVDMKKSLQQNRKTLWNNLKGYCKSENKIVINGSIWTRKLIIIPVNQDHHWFLMGIFNSRDALNRAKEGKSGEVTVFMSGF